MERLKKIKEEYNNVSVPNDLDNLISSSSRLARRQRRFIAGIHWFGVGAVLAVILVTVVLRAWKVFN